MVWVWFNFHFFFFVNIDRLTERSLELRQKHWDRFEMKKLEEFVKTEELTKVDPEKVIANYFDDSAGMKLLIHIMLTLGIFGTGIGSYVLIANNVSLSIAVSEGVTALGSDNVNVFGWVCLIMFWVFVIIYFHKEFVENTKDIGYSLFFLFHCGVKSESADKNIETVFNTPQWENAPKEFQDFMAKSKSKVAIQEEIKENKGQEVALKVDDVDVDVNET